MQALLEYASYMPHGYCLFWQPWLVALYVGSDLLIFLAYSAIPIALLVFLRRRPDIRYWGLVALFAAFILLCGITHLVSVLTLWVPVYPLHGIVKLVTGVVSAVTAGVLFFLIPRLVAIPSPHQLAEANARLRAEVQAHKRTLAELREIQQTLEEQIERRTADLTQANRQLSVMTSEAVHRSRNLLSVVSALAKQTASGAPDMPTFMERFLGRTSALSNATAAVMSGPNSISAPLAAVAHRQLEPLLLAFGDRIAVRGEPVETSAEAAQQIALVLHELGTNAVKFGALSVPDGTVDLAWEVVPAQAGADLVLSWTETMPATPAARDATPSEGGFGTRLLMTAVPATLGGRARRSFEESGVIYELRVPLESILPHAPAEPVAADDPVGSRSDTAAPYLLNLGSSLSQA